MRKIFNVSSQALGFLGAFLAFLYSWRTASRFIEVEYRTEFSIWFWNHSGEFGFFLIAAAFLIQLILAITEKVNRNSQTR